MVKLRALKVTFLGTGTSQGIPVIGSNHPVCRSSDPKDKRLRVSVLVQVDDLNFVIDCGPDFRQQMLSNQVRKLDAILFTHEHSDHTVGLDDIRPYFFKQGDIPVYAHQRVMSSLQKRFDYIFDSENKYPGAPSVQEHVITNTAFTVKGVNIIPVEVMHNRVQVFGFRIRDFAYITDAKIVEDEEAEKLKGVDVLVVNALRKEPHHSHFNLEEALDFINKIKPEKAFLTHISHMLGFHEEVQAQLPPNVYLAYDNLQIEI